MGTVILLLSVVAFIASMFAWGERRRSDPTALFGQPDAEPHQASGAERSWRTRFLSPLGFATIALAVGAILVTIDVLRGPHTGFSTRSTHGLARQVTAERGVEAEPALSPDGAYIAYRQEINGKGAIMVRAVDDDLARNVTAGLDGDHGEPAFSPDGRQIAFRSTHANGGIFIIDRDGGSARRLTAFGTSPAWSPDGSTIVFATRSGGDPSGWNGSSEGWTVDVRTGQTSRLIRQDFRQPAVSPDGKRVAYWSSSAPRGGGRRFPPRIWVAGIDGSSPQPVSRGMSTDWSPVWSPGGEFLYFLSDRGGEVGIWRVSIDARTSRPSDEPVRINVAADRAVDLTIAGDGGHLAWSTLEWSPALFRVGFSADARAIRGAPDAVAEVSMSWTCAEPSPDATAVAFVTPGPTVDVHVLDTSTGRVRAITSDAAHEGCPRWSPDGRRLAFHAEMGGSSTLWIAQADGSSAVDAHALGPLEHPVWHPDGQSLAAWDPRASALRLVTLAGKERPSSKMLGVPPHPFTPVAWSPDGSHIAGTSAGSLWLYVVATRMYEPLLPGSAPTWLRSGRRLIYAADGRLMMIDLPTRYTREILAMPDLYLDTPVLSADERVLFFNRNVPEANVWILVLDP